MVYMRIDRNKFWGWVVVSLLIGVLIGSTFMFFARSASSGEVAQLKAQMASEAASSTAQMEVLQSSAASLETSVAALEAANAQLAADLAAAKTTKTSTTTTTTATGIEFVSRSASPSSVSSSGTITLTVKVKGHPDKVRVQIKGAGSISYDQTFYLSKVSTSSSGTETWRTSVHAPKTKGTYYYYAGAFLGSKKTTMGGTQSFKVK
jgi:hypothetical protein